MKLFLSALAPVFVTFTIIASLIIGKICIAKIRIEESKAGYDKGYIQGRVETEETMRTLIRACIGEDAEDMADCLQEL